MERKREIEKRRELTQLKEKEMRLHGKREREREACVVLATFRVTSLGHLRSS